MEPFIPEPIKDIILHYLNPHELYIEELRNKTKDIKIDTHTEIDVGYSGSLMVIKKDVWFISSICFLYPKNNQIKKLNKRSNERNKMFGILETDKYGSRNNIMLATNFCYVNY